MDKDKLLMTNEGIILRIIDVNLNRATEGMRVVEDICRFILEDSRSTLALKRLRGELSRIIRIPACPARIACVAGGRQARSDYQKGEDQRIRISEKLIKARKAEEDIGREMYTKAESQRANIESIFKANMKRAEEAVRCLEEFSKLLDPQAGKKFKALRFKLYELEKAIAPEVIKLIKLDFGLYVITDPQDDHTKTVRRVIANGVKAIQLRDKTISKNEYFSLAKKIEGITRRAGATFILNDYWDLVSKVGADGVHLGQEDLARVSLRKVRKEMGEDKIIGISTHSFEQALRAEKLGADYISVGPIFKTPSKPRTRPVGLSLLRRALKKVKTPVVAIGGIDRTRIDAVRKTGCQRVAAIRAAQELCRNQAYLRSGDF